MIPDGYLPELCTIRDLSSKEWICLSTPFLDPSFDHLEICVKEMDDYYLLSDVSDCWGYLSLNGFGDRKIANWFKKITRCTGVQYNDLCLERLSSDKRKEAFQEAYYDLIQCMVLATGLAIR